MAEEVGGALLASGQPAPFLDARPDLPRHLEHYWTAFVFLDGDRPVGMGLGAIPTTAIVTYARDLLGIDDHDILRRFVRMVRAIDGAYLEHHAERSA